MRQLLKAHPRAPKPVGVEVEVDIVRPRPYELALSYLLTGNVGALRMPPVTTPMRVDDLWRHTCFEAFVHSAFEDYWEFNFSPSTNWAAYQFTGYRSGMRPIEIAPPVMEVRADTFHYTFQAVLRLDSLSEVLNAATWRLGLSAVLEDTGGHISYWALVHPPGRPDFHHPDAFACELASAEGGQE